MHGSTFVLGMYSSCLICLRWLALLCDAVHLSAASPALKWIHLLRTSLVSSLHYMRRQFGCERWRNETLCCLTGCNCGFTSHCLQHHGDPARRLVNKIKVWVRPGEKLLSSCDTITVGKWWRWRSFFLQFNYVNSRKFFFFCCQVMLP